MNHPTKTNEPVFHRVSKSINKPLTIWGVERRLFFLAVIMGAATFNFFASLFSGLVMFGSLYGFARWATRTDPQVLRILLNSAKFRTLYDPARRAPVQPLRILRHDPAR
jgi:type IV secretory pathway TrbD component